METINLETFKLFLITIYDKARQPITDNFDDDAKEIYSRIPKDFTDEDIIKCFNKGVYKELCNYYTLSPVTFNDFIKEYRSRIWQPQRIEPAMQIAETTKPTEEEQRKIMKEGCIDIFNRYKSGDMAYFIRNASNIYEWLLKQGIGKIDEKEMSAIIEKAKLNVVASQKCKHIKLVTKGALGDINSCKNIVESVMNNIFDIRANALISTEIDRICLQIFFDKLIEMEGNISDYLNF